MNKKRVKYAIKLMKRAKNLKMGEYQRGEDYARTLHDLHEMGSKASFGGYIALSPMFQEVGGYSGYEGYPILNGRAGWWAVAEFFQVHRDLYPIIEAINYGDFECRDVGEPLSKKDHLILSKREYKALDQLNKLCDNTKCKRWKKRHLINMLKALKDGEFDWLIDYEEGEE